MSDARPLLATGDDQLLESLLELAAAAGVVAQVARDPVSVRARWRGAPLVLLGADLAGSRLLAESPPRVGVLLVCRGSPPVDLGSRSAADFDEVLSLPAAEKQLVRRLATCVAPGDSDALVVGVLGGCGGAGASVLAASLATTAVRRGERTLLVDLDAFGGGLDLLLGLEEDGGLRWPDLLGGVGQSAPAALREALPTAQGVAVLSHTRRCRSALSDAAICAVVEAGREAGGLTVLDVPRYSPVATVAASLADELIMVVPADVRSVSAAVQLAEWLSEFGCNRGLVVRRSNASTLTTQAVGRVVALPLLGEMRSDAGLGPLLCSGLPLRVGKHGNLSALCEQVLDQVSGDGRAAA